ncbi:MAG: hypothetical protein L0G99_12750 [Propionibacteriales bacterium]|nr:hypothetical protein [Propionibacteriales bacterium]
MRIVLVGHGTANPAGQDVGWRIRDEVAARLPGVDVAWAWVDVARPRLADVLTPASDQVVVPVFLASGYHVRTDLPAIIAAAGGRARVTPAVGPELIGAVADRLRTAETASGQIADAVVLGAAGTTSAAAAGEVAVTADQLAERLRRPVGVGFVSAATPRLGEAITQARSRYGSDAVIAIATWLLAPGHFHDQLGLAGADLVAEPIADHPLLVETVLRRVREAAGPVLPRLGAVG